jgi:hypothetical protein
MKVLDLQCPHGHGFEGWFGSEEDFHHQLTQGMVECPMCGDTAVNKLPTAPRLNLGASEQRARSSPEQAEQATWLEMARKAIRESEDVGNRFAEEARRMHTGKTAARPIRGYATISETRELVEDGIGVMPLPIPHAMKGPVQ